MGIGSLSPWTTGKAVYMWMVMVDALAYPFVHRGLGGGHPDRWGRISRSVQLHLGRGRGRKRETETEKELI